MYIYLYTMCEHACAYNCEWLINTPQRRDMLDMCNRLITKCSTCNQVNHNKCARYLKLKLHLLRHHIPCGGEGHGDRIIEYMQVNKPIKNNRPIQMAKRNNIKKDW